MKRAKLNCERKDTVFRITFIAAFWIVIFSAVAQAQDEKIPILEVRVEGTRTAKKGEVGVAVFNSRLGYPTHLEHAYETEWTGVQEGKEAVETVFDSLPAGEYAVSVLHDENGNRSLERSKLGFPKEGVAFSNDQKVKLSAPKFDKCKFHLSLGENKKIIVRLDYREN